MTCQPETFRFLDPVNVPFIFRYGRGIYTTRLSIDSVQLTRKRVKVRGKGFTLLFGINMVVVNASSSIHPIANPSRMVICISSPFLVLLSLFLSFELTSHSTIHLRINLQLFRRRRSILRCRAKKGKVS